MAVRTSSAAVQGILGDQFHTGDDLTAFIAQGSALTDWLTGKDTDSELDATMLELIERNLAAHFYHNRNQTMQSETAGGATGMYRGQTGMGLDGTLFGLAAQTLDVTGWLIKRKLEVQSGKRKAKITWLGQTESEQTGYDERMNSGYGY